MSREGQKNEENEQSGPAQSVADLLESQQERQRPAAKMRARTKVIGVEQVPAENVPEGFPVAIETTDALALTLELLDSEGETVLTYFEWSEAEASERLATLLELTGVSADRLGELEGTRLLVTVEAGYFLPVLPKGGLAGDGRAVYALAAGMVSPALVTLSGIFQLGSGIVFSTPFVVLWLLSTLLVVPLALYVEGRYRQTRTDWDGSPLLWAALSVFPMVEIVVVPLYLFSRANDEPLA